MTTVKTRNLLIDTFKTLRLEICIVRETFSTYFVMCHFQPKRRKYFARICIFNLFYNLYFSDEVLKVKKNTVLMKRYDHTVSCSVIPSHPGNFDAYYYRYQNSEITCQLEHNPVIITHSWLLDWDSIPLAVTE